MINNRIGKENISINKIGGKRFWIGIFAGLFSSISIAYFFNYSREILRFITGANTDLLVQTSEEFLFYNYFYSFLATTLGLSIVLWIWMGNNIHKRRLDKLNKRMSQTNTLMIYWVVIMLVSRLGTILTILLYSTQGYDNHLNFKDELWLLFILFPVVVFLQNWLYIRAIYKSTKWIIYSFLICVFLTFILSQITSIDQNIVNNSYYSHYKKEYRYIDIELKNAENDYKIHFDERTKDILKKRYTESLVELVNKLKMAFSKNVKVSMDTIILEKIVQQNLYLGDRFSFPVDTITNWNYALPMDVYNQIKLNNTNDAKTKELFLLLKTQIDLWNTPKIDRMEAYEYTEYDYRRYFFARYKFPYPVINQLILVRDSLISNSKYNNYHSLLPIIYARND